MALLGIDLGGTKLALAIFTEEGKMVSKEVSPLGNHKGNEVGKLITDKIDVILSSAESRGNKINAIGISVPGISHHKTGTVWAPNIPEWDDYPLLQEVRSVSGSIPVTIDSDRACYILGEVWQGNARGCRDAIFLAVGTGIGAGILVNGEVIRGSHDIAGAIGWMALDRPFREDYINCGCFEHYASGEGIAKAGRTFLTENKDYKGELKNIAPDEITSYDIFAAYNNGDPVAVNVIQQCIEFWGMAVANLISLFNPEKIIIGGGVFGPAIPLIPDIRQEAAKWAQPISINQVNIEASGLAGNAGVYGAGFLALKTLSGLNLSK
ncbi:MAG: ROK family protein [Bacteroidales bacterium]|nr:ROK family protein [Bacteroidales bacterium]